ncbi:tRNA (guanosine(37)-N1)-methyltransferase TrmD [Candidatus Parcubacteria bacterium]|nr:tRNA (guanosine(37)-N1)-methyltransferase TrmD [Patescibacteria group bacterium]MCG2688959.1 tRNA (guanosine(37)-N1)-methyltransferase TrmD [Candidatus Parcubacteria bacterium]
MVYSIISTFPEIFDSFLKSSLIKKALDKKVITVNLYNLRDYATDKRHTVDAKPYGGGAGMLYMVEPMFKAVSSIKAKDPQAQTVIFSPKGQILTQSRVSSLSSLSHLVLLCPRYEGFDQRIVELTNARELSIGNYITMGGETPAMVLIEASARLIPGVVAKEESVLQESFSPEFSLEHPQYTRPQKFLGLSVPDTLISGNHQKIKDWKKSN